jgi:hypothetical protein
MGVPYLEWFPVCGGAATASLTQINLAWFDLKRERDVDISGLLASTSASKRAMPRPWRCS